MIEKGGRTTGEKRVSSLVDEILEMTAMEADENAARRQERLKQCDKKKKEFWMRRKRRMAAEKQRERLLGYLKLWWATLEGT